MDHRADIPFYLYYACEYLHFATHLYFLSHFFFLDAPLRLFYFLSHSSCFSFLQFITFCEHNQTSLLLCWVVFWGAVNELTIVMELNNMQIHCKIVLYCINKEELLQVFYLYFPLCFWVDRNFRTITDWKLPLHFLF